MVVKTILTVTFVVLLGSALGSCSSNDKQSTQPIDSNSAAQPSNDSTSEGLPAIPYDEMVRQLAGLSKQAGIPNLKDVELIDDQSEFRIWKGFGLAYPRCFILKIENGNAAASFVSPKVVGAKAVFHKGKAIYVNRPLNAPHSGWDNLFAYLKQNGIDSSIGLALDKRYMPYPDAEELVLEMKTSSHHTMAYYIDSTATDDGKRAFGICQKIESEFDIQLACKL